MAEKQFGGQTFTESELTPAFARISAYAGERANPEQKIQALEAYAQGRGAGLGDEGAIGLASNYMERLLQGGKESDEERLQQAYRTTAALGGAADPGILRMLAKFGNQEYATQLAEASALSREGKGGLGTLADLGDKEITDKERREDLLKLAAAKHDNAVATHVPQQIIDEALQTKWTNEERKKLVEMRHGADQFTEAEGRRLQLSGVAPGEDRIRAILSDPDLAPPEHQAEIRKIAAAMGRPQTISIPKAMQAVGSSEAGKVVIGAHGAKVAEESADELRGPGRRGAEQN